MRCRNCLLWGTALLALSVAACSRQSTDPAARGGPDVLEVKAAAIQRSNIHSSLELVGTLFPWKFAMVTSEVDGLIKSIPDSGEKIEYEIQGQTYSAALFLDLGHPVKQGDVLMEIDPTEHELALKAAEARLHLAEKELANLEAWKRPEEVEQRRAEFEEASAILEEAEAESGRLEQMRPDKVISQSQYDEDRRVLRTARAIKSRAELALKIAEDGPTEEERAVAEARVAAAKAEVAVQADKLSNCTIRCPLETAVIVERFLGVGDRVTATPKTEIMRVIDPTILLAEIGVPEKYQGRIRRGDIATLRAQGVTDRGSPGGGVRAMVVLVNEQIDPATRTFRVRVGVDNHEGLFKAGTFVKVELAIDSVSEVLVAPAEAVTFAEGEPAVFVYREGQVQERPVKVGLSNRTHYEIVAGLSEGEQVVMGDTSLLADGLRVRLQGAGPLAAVPSEVRP